jgi:hypothetical protein
MKGSSEADELNDELAAAVDDDTLRAMEDDEGRSTTDGK